MIKLADTIRLEAVAEAICQSRNRADWPCNGLDYDAELARVALEAADAVDILRIPVAMLQGKVPLVLYFACRADADAFVAIAKSGFIDPVEIDL